MTSEKQGTYFESRIEFTGDPLTAVSRLASSGFHRDYVVYESDGQWSFAGGVLAELSLDRTGVWMRQATETWLPWNGAPLRQVQRLLDGVRVKGWRAYGWAAFELAYAKDGDVSDIGDQRLLHLIVPHTEVRIGAGGAYLRSADRETLSAMAAVLSAEPAEVPAELTPVDVRRHGAEDYQRAVKLAVDEINTHKLQKVIFSRIVPVEQQIDLVSTYVSGRRGNSPARSFIVHLDGIESAGFSPEIVMKVGNDGRVVSQPLAGTRALTEDPVENKRLRADLVSDAKEIYEHAISVQTACDELYGVCTPGSVMVEEFMTIEERGSVQHLASRVAGQLAAGRRVWDAFGAVFPAVTASGVPKDAAYASIRTHETKARGLYSGAVFTVDQDGSMDVALVLRAVYRENGVTWLQAGAGIVGQSLPEREFEETCEKLDSVARFLVAAGAPARNSNTGPPQVAQAVMQER
jgi:anthranilate synthase component 1/salicylate synthetase